MEQRTWTNTPLGLKTGDTRETGHGKKIEEDLRCVEDDE
jgi:hypothetical protein